MKKLKKRVFIILLALMIGLVNTACKDSEKYNQESHKETTEEIDGTDLVDENTYLIKLEKIAYEIIENEVPIQRILNQAYAKYGDIVENIYFADHNGKLILSPALQLPEDYDARQRPWYKNALVNEVYKPDVYYDQTVEKHIQTIARALYKDGELVGVLGMDYETKNNGVIENLNRKNNSVKTTEEKSFLPEEKKEALKKYAEKIKDVVETEDNQVALKKYIDGQVENSINGVATIYLANSSEVFMISPYVQLPENYNPSLRPWYELAIKEGFHISDTFLDVESNDIMVSISTKVELEDNTFGVLGIDFNIDL